jgi:hypothetical protein
MRQAFVNAGVIEKYDEKKHRGDIYRRLPQLTE